MQQEELLSLAINDKVQRGVHHHQQVIDQDCHPRPFGKLCPLPVKDVDELVNGYEDLADVADEEEKDDAEEDQGYSAVTAASRLLLNNGKKIHFFK